MEAMDGIDSLPHAPSSTLDIKAWKNACCDAMNDDFNSPVLIAQLFEGVRFVNLLKDGKETLSQIDLQDFKQTMHGFIFDVLGLTDEKSGGAQTDKLESVVNLLIDMRNQARANKDFALSDQIRDQLIAKGIQLKDGKDGTTFSITD